MDNIIIVYKNFLSDKKKLSDSTISAYYADIHKFKKFIIEKYGVYDFKDLNKSFLLSYLLFLEDSKKASSSISRSMSVIRNFLLFLFHNNYIDENLVEDKIEIPKAIKKLPEILTVDEVNRILSQPDDSILGKRDKAMLETLYTSGLKVNELIDIQLSDLDLKFKVIRCNTKNTTRVLPIGALAQNAIECYIYNSRNLLEKEKCNHLFLSYNGKKISRQGFWKIVKKYALKAGIEKNISLSTFRHSFASHMIENGIDKEVLKDTLGNTSIASVQKYLDLNRRRNNV